MATKKTEPIYINKPGGVLLHTAAGDVENYEYGREVHLDDLADYQQETIHEFTDSTPRTQAPVTPEIQAAREEEAAAAEAEGTLPDNVEDLDENGFIALLKNYDGEPHKQAEIIVYELSTANRQAVIDTASAEAVQIAYDNMGIENPNPVSKEEVKEEKKTASKPASSSAKKTAADAKKTTPPPAGS